MPVYNEAATVMQVLHRVLATPYTREVIVVDDASTDGTADILRTVDDARVRVLSQPRNFGKGAALRRGFDAVTSPFVLIQDADLEYDPEEYGTLLGPLLDGRADVVYGSRFYVSEARRVLYFWHSLGNRALTTVSNAFTNLNLSDMETCYKAFRREVIESIDLREDRFGIEPEFTAKIARGGWRVYEVGIGYSGRTYEEGKKIGWRDGVRAMYCVVRYSPVAQRLKERLYAVPRLDPSGAAEIDEELGVTLDALEGAPRYADWIIEQMAPHVSGRILEIGAGLGTMTGRLAGLGKVVASEPSVGLAARLRERYSDSADVEVICADAVEAAGHGPFDAAVAVNVLEHIDDDVGALRALRSCLRPGGTVALWVPAYEALFSDFDRRVGHHRRYRLSTLAARIDEAGLELVDARYVHGPGAVAWFLYATMRGGTPTASPLTRLYDRAAIPVIRRKEARWPARFGQSVLCVARRPDAVDMP
jgi:SAM-dependent methyltransferase